MTLPAIKEILMEELETVTDALAMYSDDPEKHSDDLKHWTERLARVNRALQPIQGLVTFTQQEKDTLLLLIEFHDGAFEPGEDAPFDVHAAESARAKLKG